MEWPQLAGFPHKKRLLVRCHCLEGVDGDHGIVGSQVRES